MLLTTASAQKWEEERSKMFRESFNVQLIPQANETKTDVHDIYTIKYVE